MTNFEKMKYLHRNAIKTSGAGKTEKKDMKKSSDIRPAGKKRAALPVGTEEREGMTGERRSGDPAEDISG